MDDGWREDTVSVDTVSVTLVPYNGWKSKLDSIAAPQRLKEETGCGFCGHGLCIYVPTTVEKGNWMCFCGHGLCISVPTTVQRGNWMCFCGHGLCISVPTTVEAANWVCFCGHDLCGSVTTTVQRANWMCFCGHGLGDSVPYKGWNSKVEIIAATLMSIVLLACTLNERLSTPPPPLPRLPRP